MVLYEKYSEAKVVNGRPLCSECVGHVQGSHREFYDCKNVFNDEKGNSIAQCCCYSDEHGKRERRSG